MIWIAWVDLTFTNKNAREPNTTAFFTVYLSDAIPANSLASLLPSVESAGSSNTRKGCGLK